MANAFDASIKQLYAADKGTDFVADTVAPGAPFDLVADIEIGEDLNGFVNDLKVFVGIRNVTTSGNVLTKTFPHPLTPKNNQAEHLRLRLPIDVTWTAADGDLLEAVATVRVNAGVHTDYSHAQSDQIIVAT